jgi:hypothetical protein
MDGRGYVVRESENEVWSTLEASPNEGEKFDPFIKRTLTEQAGATLKRLAVTGYLDCKATSHNPGAPAGTRVVQPLVIAIASAVKDQRPGAKYMRRRLPANEYVELIRKRYHEYGAYFGDAISTNLIRHARGEA